MITAVLLGGTDFKGGRGTIIGTALAVLLIGVVENGLELLGVSAQVTTAVIGGLLILSILVDIATMRCRRARRGAQRAELPDRRQRQARRWSQRPRRRRAHDGAMAPT